MAEEHPSGDPPDSDDSFLRGVAATPTIDPSLRLDDGDVLGSFRIERELGRGGMGVVYQARDDKLDREVAIKVLPSHLAHDEERRKRFLREARSAARIVHPNVATVYEVGDSGAVLFIAMELVHGESLRARIARGPTTAREAVRIVTAAASGLAKAHALGIVHRDLKPDNVMVAEDGLVKVLDFGLAKQREREASVLSVAETVTAAGTESLHTAEGKIMGTPGYMSPEQARGQPVDPRTDVFALGILLYELVTGEQPFGGATPLDKLAAIARDEPATLVDAPALDRIIKRCLEKEREARYADAEALLADLEALEVADAVMARTAPSGASKAPVPSTRHGSSRRGLYGIAAVVAVAGALFIATRGDAPAPADVASAAPSASVRPPVDKPMRLTDLPVNGTPKPEALAAYRKGLAALQSGAWAPAGRHFEKAAELDPDFPEAALRVAQIGFFQYGPEKKLEAARRAASMEATLSERDRLLFRQISALVLRPEPDRAEAARAIVEATKRFPKDAEFHMLFAAIRAGTPEDRVEHARRAVELDPDYADGWQTLSWLHQRAEQFEEAARARDRCIAVSSHSIDCLRDRGMIHASHGRCAEWLADVREIQARVSAKHHLPRHALALASTNAPWADVETLLATDWASTESARTYFEGLAMAYRGRFDGARKALARVKLTERDGHEAMSLRVGILLETGDEGAAVALAREYLSSMRTGVDTGPLIAASDNRVAMTLLLARHGGDTPPIDELRTSVEAEWHKRAPRQPFMAWWAAHRGAAHDAASAREALSHHPDDGKVPERLRQFTSADAFRYGATAAGTGHVHLLAGDLEQAEALLTEAANGCPSFDAPLVSVRMHLWRGEVFEAKGETEAACGAYGAVVERWGEAKPKSVTAQTAQARRTALGCK